MLSVLGLLSTAAASHAAEVGSARPPVPAPMCTATPLVASGALPAPSTARIAAQVGSLPRAGITLSASTTVDGAIAIEGRAGDLLFRKKVAANGSFTLTLEARRDKVTVEVSEHAITVVRQKGRTVVTKDAEAEEQLEKVGRLLADSRAVRSFRMAAAAVEQSQDTSPAAAAVLLADAVLGPLTGDAGAPSRVARHLSRSARSRMLRVAASANCYQSYERIVVDAYNDLEGCFDQFDWWHPFRRLCGWVWTLQIESAWFSLISCSGFGGLF
jgi:hypothetical protein